MEIKFFDNAFETPKSREDVRLRKLGLFLYEDLRRVAVGFDITPFLEPPSIQVTIRNPQGQEVSSLNVIETADRNFHLTMHLRDQEPSDTYEVTAVLYYATPQTERVDVDTVTRTLDATQPGEQ
ncbi:MAG: hypothetical protein HF973_11765 [Chloroflexi bacterium]|nr:hypothetical protein [Chloroflexota bacterium]